MELRSTENELQSLVSTYSSLYYKSMNITTTSNNTEFPSLPRPSFLNDEEKDNNDNEKSSTIISVIEIHNEIDIIKNKLLNIDINKFRKRLQIKDPITNQPRYGIQTSKRVIQMIQLYDELYNIIIQQIYGIEHEQQDTKNSSNDNVQDVQQQEQSNNTNNTESTATIHSQIQKIANEEMEMKQKLELEEKQKEIERLEMEHIQQEEARRIQEEQEQARIRAEQEEQQRLALEAQAIRNAIIQQQQEADTADRLWEQSIPKTLQSVQEQLDVLSSSTTPENNMNALTALHAIYTQIIAHPEENNYRRIRRDHPKFLHDIGQYNGGKEVLIAGGFRLGVVEEIPSYVCTEPNVEHDLDGWTAWYDHIKGTLDLIEKQMMK